MKFFLFFAVLIITAFIFFYFLGNLNRPINPIESGKTSSSAENSEVSSSIAVDKSPAPTTAPTTTTTPVKNSTGTQNPARLGSSTVPSGFKGPTGQPHIIGPTGPPPNY